LEVVALPGPFENIPARHVWFAYEYGAKPQQDDQAKILARYLKKPPIRGLLLAIIRRNGRVALVEIVELKL